MEPTGVKFSGNIRLPEQDIDSHFLDTLHAIDRVHGVNFILSNKIPVVFDGMIRGNGLFEAIPGVGMTIKISPNTALFARGEVLVHEIGHCLDLVIGDLRGFSSATSPLWEKWRVLVEASHAIQTIRSTNNPVFTPYWLQPKEQFARCYFQYITIRSSDVGLSMYLESELEIGRKTGYTTQWESDDFERIADEIDSVFEKLKWLTKKKP